MASRLAVRSRFSLLLPSSSSSSSSPAAPSLFSLSSCSSSPSSASCLFPSSVVRGGQRSPASSPPCLSQTGKLPLGEKSLSGLFLLREPTQGRCNLRSSSSRCVASSQHVPLPHRRDRPFVQRHAVPRNDSASAPSPRRRSSTSSLQSVRETVSPEMSSSCYALASSVRNTQRKHLHLFSSSASLASSPGTRFPVFFRLRIPRCFPAVASPFFLSLSSSPSSCSQPQSFCPPPSLWRMPPFCRPSTCVRFFSSTPPSPSSKGKNADGESQTENSSSASSSRSSSSSSSLSSELKSLVEFCQIASGMPVGGEGPPSSSSPSGSKIQTAAGWTYTREDEKFVRSPGGFLGLILAFNQKFARLRDLGVHINLSCREGSRQALRLLSFELTEGLDTQREAVAEFLHKTAQQEEKKQLRKTQEEKESRLHHDRDDKGDNARDRPSVSSEGAGVRTAEDSAPPKEEETDSGVGQEEEEREHARAGAEEGGAQKKDMAGQDSRVCPAKDEKLAMSMKEKLTWKEELSRIARAGLLEDLRLCVAEPLFTGLQAKAAELIEQGCTVKFDLHEIQSVVINKLWTVCGVLPSSHAAPLSPSSCTLVAVAPALHVVVPLSNSSSLSYPPPTEYIRTSHGLLSSTGGEGEEEDGSADGESEDGLKKRAEGEEEDDLERRLSREKPKRADAGRSTGEEAKTSDRTSPGAGQAAQRRPGDMSFLERLQLGFERMELLTEAMTKGLAVVMEVKLLCTQTFDVFDRNNKLIWGSDGEEEKVVHTLRFQLTARHDGTRQWGFPVFQPSPWMLTDWNGLVGSEYPCDVHVFRNVVLLEKNQEPPKGRRICFE